MFKNCLIIMPFNLPWNWSADYQKQTCLVLHQQNLVIAYMHQSACFWLKKPIQNAYPKIKNIIFYNPKYLIPFRRFKAIEQSNQLLCLAWLKLRYGMNKKTLLWIFDPIFYFFPKIKKLIPKIISVYDCVDYHWSRNKLITSIIRRIEVKLIQNVDYFFVNSYSLKNIHQNIRKPDAVVPLGFAIDEFKKKQKKGNNLQIYNPQKKPVIGYIGSINYRLDYKLLFQLIRNNPVWLFVFIGTIQEEDQNLKIKTKINKLLKFKNVYFLPYVGRSNIVGLIHLFDIATVPYDIKYPLNKYCYPMKLIEYFYMQKPVLATPIEELNKINEFIRIGKNYKEWKSHIQDLLKYPLSLEQRLAQKELTIKNSWKNKIKAICNSINN